MRRYHAVFVQKNKYTLRTWQTEDAHSLVQELNNKMAGGDYNGITKACDEGLSGNFWLLSFKISYLCLPLFYETRTTPSCHPSGCAYRQL